jgi:hypothetical protein
MAVGIEPETMPERCFLDELGFRYALEVVDELAVGFIQLPQHLGEGKAPFLFRHLGVEGIDAAVLDRVPGWLAPLHDERQIL